MRWVWFRSHTRLDEGGQPAYAYGVVQDITERKQADSELRRAKAEWERTFDSVPDLIAILDDQHRIVRVNLAMAARLDASPEACTGLSCFACVHGTAGPIATCPHTLTLLDGREHVAEVHEERLGGDFLVSTTPLLDEHGQMMGAVHVARDITAAKRAEEELKKLNRTLKAVSSSSQAILHAFDEQSFLQEACRIVTVDCGYRMVWIGFAEDDESKTVRPVAWSGKEDGYFPGSRLPGTQPRPASAPREPRSERAWHRCAATCVPIRCLPRGARQPWSAAMRPRWGSR